MLIPPLKIPLGCDLKRSLSSWLDETDNDCGFLSAQVQDDLDRLSKLRTALVEAGGDYSKAEAVLDDYQEYHAALLECEAKGFPSSVENNILSFPWSSEDTRRTHSCLHWERANLLWNVATLLAYQASLQNKAEKAGWNQAQILLQGAASTMHHLQKLLQGNNSWEQEFGEASFWEMFMLAQAQMATYYLARATSKPRHVVLAKLATAAIPILEKAATKNDEHQVHCKAWSTWMATLAQYHEACMHRQKKQLEQEVARLDKAREAVSVCQEYVYQNDDPQLKLVQAELPKMVRTIRDRQLQVSRMEISDRTVELRDIRGEVLVRSNYPLVTELTTLSTPLFEGIKRISLDGKARQAIQKFQREMDGMIYELARVAEEKMEEGRMALAEVNLPHSLTAYKQEQMGGGIPEDLWIRVEAMQEQGVLSNLKRDMWELRQAAESALAIQTRVAQQLEENEAMDNLFRQDNPHFEGTDVPQVQRSFHESLENYSSLLKKSQEGDAVLIKRLEALDTDPKYKLLQFQKSQLDRLLPGADDGDACIDTSRLARLLVELSALFDERQELLENLRNEAKKYDIVSRMAQVDPSSPTAQQDYDRVVRMSQTSFGGIAYDIRINIDQQAGLVDGILAENDVFVNSRQRQKVPASAAGASESCIAMMEDAIEETQQLVKHVKEGREFYNIILPRLQNLQKEVSDASVRLTVQRCEHEESTRGARRDSHASRRDSSSEAAAGDGRLGSQAINPPLNDEVHVDDEKVANLVEMDFDFEKVVAALKKHNNNVEQALNELLCG